MTRVIFKYRRPKGLLPTHGRISESPPAEQAYAQPAAPEPTDDTDGTVHRWWHESSYELKKGLDVTDDFEHTVPGPLLDELFKPPGCR